MNHYPRPVGMFFRLAINKEKSASLARIDDLPEEAAREKEIFRRFGPQSSAIFLFKVGGKIIGAMAFGSVLREREWTDDVVNRLRLLVEIIGNAIARTRVEERTREALEENRRLRQRLERESCSRKRKRFADLRASLGKARPSKRY